MPCKDFAHQIKAVGPDDGLAEGEFLAYASVFGNVDSYGDVVEPGAFTKTLEDWESRGYPIPLLWGHDTSDPDHNVGEVRNAAQDDHGLLVKGAIDLEGPKGPQVYRLVKGRRVNNMSFAYDIVDAAEEDGHQSLKELALHEVSIVPLGANAETEILTVKAAQLTASLERTSAEIDAPAIKSLLDVTDRLSAVLERIITGTTENASGTGAANGSTPKGEPEEPSPNPSVDSWLSVIQLTENERRRTA
jgi:HK97 family phage prohead protease